MLYNDWVQSWMTAGSGMVYSEMKFQDDMEDGDRLDGFRLWICVRRMSDSSEVLESTSRGPTTSIQFTIQAIPGTGTSGELTVTSARRKQEVAYSPFWINIFLQ
jgi:redox-sensitive bicupin YhaK (pirin superfamily)